MGRRQVTTAVTLTVLVVVLAAMAVYGFRAVTAPLPSSSAGGAPDTCSAAETQVKRFLSRGDVQVSVYNAGSRSGLAGSTLDQVTDAGFRAGNAGNAPRTADVRRAVVWTTKADDPAAQLVAQSFGAGTRVEVTATDLGPGVDVLVGNRFKKLDGKAPGRIRLAKPVENCVQVD